MQSILAIYWREYGFPSSVTRMGLIPAKVRKHVAAAHGASHSRKSEPHKTKVIQNVSQRSLVIGQARRLARHTKEGGHLILSGLDYSDNRPVGTILAGEGMNVVNVRFLEEFVTQVWHRPSAMFRKEP